MKVTKALLAAVLVLGLGACSSTESEKEAVENVDQAELTDETGSEEAEEVEAETNEEAKYEGNVGDTLSYGGIAITLDSVSDSDSVDEDLPFTAELDEGMELVHCNLSVKNETGEPITFDLKLFSMENNNNEVSEPVLKGADVNEVYDGTFEIEAGQTVTCTVGFEEPEGSSPLILYYLKDTTSDNEQTLTWTINR